LLACSLQFMGLNVLGHR